MGAATCSVSPKFSAPKASTDSKGDDGEPVPLQRAKSAKRIELDRKVSEARVSRRKPNAQKRADEAITQAATRGNLALLQKAFKKGGDVQQTNQRLITPLMHAAASNSKEALDVVKALLDKGGVFLDLKDHQGWSAIHHACRNGNTDIANHLIEYEADPTETTSDEKSCLILATVAGKADLVADLLKIKAVRPQVQEKDVSGWTPLYYAVKLGIVSIVKQLLDKSPKVNLKDSALMTPLMVACEYGSLEVVQLLCKKKAQIEAIDKDRSTALTYACLGGFEQIAICLVTDHNANAYHEDAHQDTPMTIASDMSLISFKNTVLTKTHDDNDD